MSQNARPAEKIETLEQALARIALLEQKLDEAIDIILRRDDQLTATERQLAELEEKLEAAEERLPQPARSRPT